MKKNTVIRKRSFASRKRSRAFVAVRTPKMKLKKGDKVIVVSGKDKGKTGEIGEVLAKEGRVIIEGVNMVKRHIRKAARGQSGRIVEHAASIHASNVMLLDPETKKGTRVGRRIENGKTVRFAKKSGTALK